MFAQPEATALGGKVDYPDEHVNTDGCATQRTNMEGVAESCETLFAPSRFSKLGDLTTCNRTEDTAEQI